MYTAVIFMPLVSATSIGFGGWYLGQKASARLSSFFSLITVILAYLIFFEVGLSGTVCRVPLGSWIGFGFFDVPWELFFDSLTAVMLVVVTSISTVVHFYSTSYMDGDPHLSRFLSYLSFFTFFMLVLVTGGNLVQLFVGWEGVGLCSYLLINFWYSRLQANKAAIKAIIVNRVGDFGLIFAIILSFWTFHSLDFVTIFSLVPRMVDQTVVFFGWTFSSLELIGFFCLVAAVGKSAQLGLHVWLPDAMEGPTPVSALIHAATMVTAGVFILLRMSPLLEYTPVVRGMVVIVGALTAFFAATVGLFQNDLKRVIAYSTCSQLGYMVFACGLSEYPVALFHLYNHAFFKALLFLSAGVIIHGLADEQDMRRMGGLTRLFPLTYLAILVGSLSLMGFPFLTGFYSKDVILELSVSFYTVSSEFASWFGVLSAILTAFYSFRLIYLVFLARPSGFRRSLESAHDGTGVLAGSLVVLFFGSIFLGFLSRDMFIGFGSPFFGVALGHGIGQDSVGSVFTAEFLPAAVKLLPVVFSLFGAGLALVLYLFFRADFIRWQVHSRFGFLVTEFLSKKWYFDGIYGELVMVPTLNIAHRLIFKHFDRGLAEPSGLVYRLKVAAAGFHGFLDRGFMPALLASLWVGTLLIFYWESLMAYVFFDEMGLVVFLVACLVVGSSGRGKKGSVGAKFFPGQRGDDAIARLTPGRRLLPLCRRCLALKKLPMDGALPSLPGRVWPGELPSVGISPWPFSSLF